MPYSQINEFYIGMRAPPIPSSPEKIFSPATAPIPVGLVDKDMYNKDVLLLNGFMSFSCHDFKSPYKQQVVLYSELIHTIFERKNGLGYR